MEKTNPLYKKDYPEWKKNLWRALRTFFIAFLCSFVLIIKDIDITGIENLNALKEYLIKLVMSALVGGVSGGIKALFEWLRDKFPDNIILARLPL